MGTRIAAVLLLTLGFVTGCGPRPVTKIVTIELEPAQTELRLEAHRILAARFNAFSASYTSSIESKLDGESIVFEFHGEAPSDETLRSIGTPQGILRLYPAGVPSQLLMTDRDIENVSVSIYEDRGVINYELTESAGQRLLAFTVRNVGRQVITTWDRVEISRATVQGAFGRQFQTSGLDLQFAKIMGVVLKNGRLPVAVRNLNIEIPAASR